jgi:short-subunit dehydrogenase
MPITPLDQESAASVDRQLDINLRAVIHGTQEAMRRMRPRGRGHIVNVASLAGKAGYPNLATYAATKHAVVGLSEAVRFELQGSGVEVSCVMPGIVNTELSAGMPEARGVKNLTPEQVAAEIVSALKIPRFDVYVPRSTGPLMQFAAALPRRAREAMARALKADQVATAADTAKRTAYESRAASSAPAAEPEPPVKEAA